MYTLIDHPVLFWHFYAESAKQTKVFFPFSVILMSTAQNKLIYKIETRLVWELAMAKGVYVGAKIDLDDGFIHFSTAEQARETASKHFDGREGLIIAAIDSGTLEDNLKWEVSRGDALFPHLYAHLDMASVVATFDLPLDKNGNHIFADEIV